MYTRLIKTTLAIISVICLSHSLAQTAAAAEQAQNSSAYQVRAVKTDIGSDNLSLLLIGDNAPAYTVSERFDPYRLVVDIAEAEFNSEINLDQLLPENDIAKLHLSILKDQEPAIARLEFALGTNSTYDVQRVLNNLRIEITAQPAGAETATTTPSPFRVIGASGSALISIRSISTMFFGCFERFPT
jgi:type IV pilus assembly protein PilQ